MIQNYQAVKPLPGGTTYLSVLKFLLYVPITFNTNVLLYQSFIIQLIFSFSKSLPAQANLKTAAR